MGDAEGDEPEGTVPGRADERADNSLGRLLALSDGVFAIGMTLLALDLRVPQLPEGADQRALLEALRGEIPSALTYLLSFYVVANYWIAHHGLMRSVTRTHPRLIAHTLGLLLLVAALPFPSALLAEFGGKPIALVIYAGVNIAAVLLLLWLRHDLVAFDLSSTPADPEGWYRSGVELRGNLVVFVLCLPAAYLLGDNAPYTLTLLVVSGGASRILYRRHRRPA